MQSGKKIAYNRVSMVMRRSFIRIAALFLMLALPLQTLASVMLPCLHDGDMATGQMDHHDCHKAPAEQADSGSVTDECHKCQLCMLLSVSALLTPQLLVPATGGSVYTARPIDHYYQFRPGLLARPPSPVTPS